MAGVPRNGCLEFLSNFVGRFQLNNSANNEFSQVRSVHASEIAEDYVEAIADFIDKNGVCRSVDLANHFAVTQATVANTISRLQRDGLVDTEPYKPVGLTKAGRRMASKSRERHKIVYDFLLKLGVSSEAAVVDSEGIEHHVGKETLRAMQRVLEGGWPQS